MEPHTPPQSPHKRREASTRSKSRFFDAYDTRPPGYTLKDVIHQLNLQYLFGFHERACKYWLRARKAVGMDTAIHRLGKSHQKASKISDAQLDLLLHAHKKIRSLPLLEQIVFHNLYTKKRNLQYQLWTRRRARRRKKRWVRAVSKINQGKRVIYCTAYQDKTVEDFWQFIHFSDEAHLDPYQSSAEYILRPDGEALLPENMQMEHFDNLSQRLHIAATVSWHHKGALQFYNDENNNLLRPRKPRKSRYQSAAVYQQRIIDWEASLPPPPRGNAMTQVYYTARLLPVYAHEIHQHRIQYGYDCIFQQDNDPSHGTRSDDNLPKRFLNQNWITVLLHPPQSPDLNPIEACWNILKQRVRQRYFDWDTLEQYKQVVLEEWDRITIDEIRARIREMPLRCNEIVKRDGFPFKSTLW